MTRRLYGRSMKGDAHKSTASSPRQTAPDEEDERQSRATARAAELLEGLENEYRLHQEPIDVSFRQLVGPIPASDISHSVHPYPARLIRQIPRFLLHCGQLAQPGDVVVDPFCGSGTVLVEARSAGMSGWGLDCNPFACLLSRVKTTPLTTSETQSCSLGVLRVAKHSRRASLPDVVNIDTWYSSIASRTLGRLKYVIDNEDVSDAQRRFLLVTLALTADRASLRDRRIPVPVRRKDWKQHSAAQTSNDVWRAFESAAVYIGSRIAQIPTASTLQSIVLEASAFDVNSHYSSALAPGLPRPSLVLTSPPYGAAQKYVRSSSLAIGWTGLAVSADLADLERRQIGREHLHRSELGQLDAPNQAIRAVVDSVRRRDSVRAAIYAEYFRSMDVALRESIAVLRPGGHLALVAGSNVVAGVPVETHRLLSDLASAHGASPVVELRDTIRGRTLLTKRAAGGTPLHAESVHILRKDG